MCITVNKAALSNTKILCLALNNGRHFLSYSNKVENTSGLANSMILPIPGELKKEWFHNTEKYSEFMEDIIKNTTDEDYTGERSRGLKKSKGLSLSFDSFTIGMYKVGIAKGYEGIEEYINTLPENERPKISTELKAFFQKEYAGWSFVVCAFSGDKKMESQPIAFEYEPFGYDFLYFPTMDAHNGGAPEIGKMIKADHTFLFEHLGIQKENFDMKNYSPFSRRTEKPDYPSFLAERKYRSVVIDGYAANGDTYIKMEEMKNMNFLDDPKIFRLKPVPSTTA